MAEPTPTTASRPTAAERVAYLVEAALLIEATGCTTFTSGRCSDPHSGRSRRSRYGADRWCDACIARDALDRASAPHESPVDVDAIAAWLSESLPDYDDIDDAIRNATHGGFYPQVHVHETATSIMAMIRRGLVAGRSG